MDIKSTAGPNGIQVTTPGARGAAGAGGTAGAAGVGGVDRLAGGGKAAQAGAGREDEVQLSSLGSAIESLQEGSAAREARVAALREAVASGGYQVNAGQVATQLVDDRVSDGAGNGTGNDPGK